LSVDERKDPPLPELLSDASVWATLHRANALHPQGHLSDEPQFPSALGGLQTRHLDVRVRAYTAERDFLWGQNLDGSQPSPYSSAFLRPRIAARGSSGVPERSQTQESSGVPERFVPGSETESVLKITKRPRLRPKDISHRRSLVGSPRAR
jgi:hypothetical protein